MTVDELIRALEQFPPNLKMEALGVEDYETVTQVVRRPETNTVCIVTEPK